MKKSEIFLIILSFILAFALGLRVYVVIDQSRNTQAQIEKNTNNQNITNEQKQKNTLNNTENNKNEQNENVINQNTEINIEEDDDEIVPNLQKNDVDLNFLKLENKKANIVYSPLSIKYALKMLEEGATGTSKEQITDLLNGIEVTKYTSNSNMSLANVLFVRDSERQSVKTDYINRLKDRYNAEVRFDAFNDASNINNWVKEKTLNIIPSIIEDSEVNDLRFALINALAIDMEWKDKFLHEMRNSSCRFCT